jgi:GT2 family glycosyltransferase
MIPQPTTCPGISIVIPSWNGRALLERFLPSVIAAAAAFEAACRQPSEIIIADDGSQDETRVWLAAQFPHVRCESSPERAGFAPAANRGARAARYALVYLVNNDVALEPATLLPLAAHFAEPRLFAVASTVYDYNTGVLRGAGQVGEFRRGFLGIHRRYFIPQPSEGRDPSWLTLFATGGSSLFDREKFLGLGGFDESFAPFGWEDVELSLRAWKQGFDLHYEPRSSVWHQFSSTITPSFPGYDVQAIYERNRLLAHWLHLDTPAQAASHILFLLAKLPAAAVVGRWQTWTAVREALKRWDQVRAQRHQLRARQQRPLRDVLRKIAEQLDRPGVHLLDQGSAPVRPYSPSPPNR